MFEPRLLEAIPSVEVVRQKDANLYMRPLRSDDFQRGFIDLLKQLTSVGDVTASDFKGRFNLMKSCQGTYYNTVIVDKSTDKVVGAATLIVERKFIHNCANVRSFSSKSTCSTSLAFLERNHRRGHCQ